MTDAAFYADITATAQQLIAQYGRPCRIVHNPNATLATNNRPWEPVAGTPVIVDTNFVDSEHDKQMQGNTVVHQTKIKFYMPFDATITWEVSSKDNLFELNADGTTGDQYIISVAKIIAPGPFTVLYELQVMKG